MTDFEIIKKIENLKEIKPREEWVSLTKERILSNELNNETQGFSIFSFLFGFKHNKPVFVALASFSFLLGLFSFAQNTVPGDALYPLKKATEKGQSVFIPVDNKLSFELKLVNQRLEELNKVVENNNTANLASAVKEVKKSLNNVSGKLREAENTEKLAKVVVEETNKIKEARGRIEGVLSTKIGSEEMDEELKNATDPYYKIFLEQMIFDLEERTLNENQTILLKAVKDFYEEGDYDKAIEKLLEI